jgi:hypothetical protein
MRIPIKKIFSNLEGRTPAGSAHKHVSPQKGEPLILYSHKIMESRLPHTGNRQLRKKQVGSHMVHGTGSRFAKLHGGCIHIIV